MNKIRGGWVALPVLVGLLSGCGAGPATPGVLNAVGAESEYANVIQQIGGRYVHVTGIMSNPNIDPHTFEASSTDAELIYRASLVVQNGVGYDSFMNRLESATPNSHRTVVTAARVLGLPDSTANPHLFYKPGAMAAVAARIEAVLAHKLPAHSAYFRGRLKAFDRGLNAWSAAMARVRKDFPGAPVAVTEPVADYMLQAAGLSIRTPWSFQEAIMNSVDPSPQAVQIEQNLIKDRRVRVLVYNQQVVDSTTETLLKLAKKSHVPVVGVYETMPSGHDYQQWMVDETEDVYKALKDGRSSLTL